MKRIFVYTLFFFAFFSVYAGSYSHGKWTLETTPTTADVNILHNNTHIITNSRSSFNIAKDGTKYTMSAISSETQTAINDQFGSGIKVTVVGTASGAEGVTVTQDFYLYEGKDYFLTEFTIASTADLSSNYMAPIKTTSGNSTILPDGGNRVLEIPYHNNDFIRYISNNFSATGNNTTATRSYEVGGVYNESSRKGLIAGSIEHTVWKTGVDIITRNINQVYSMEVYGGRAVRPFIHAAVQTHGPVKGKVIKSPKMFVGYFDDWRDGLELYGQANAIVAPKYEWYAGKPFGWNSWGQMKTSINFDNVTGVADWMHDHLQINGFHNDNTLYIGMDSWWNESLTADQAMTLPVRLRERNGQKAGIYFSGACVHWGQDENSKNAKVGNTGYTYNDLYLRYEGEIQDDHGRALDPTHPGTKAIIAKQIDYFLLWGYRYVKLDFLVQGALEADSWYNPDITTGAMAYDYMLKYITTYMKNHPLYPKDDDVFINLSIAPVFPANYAHSRRISCDAWGTMNNIQYMLNSLTYGWWLDHVYHWNDGDHIASFATNGASLQEQEVNRSRVTAAVITGLFIAGDDFSRGDGNNGLARERMSVLLTNPEVNELARQCKSFRPVNSGTAGNNYLIAAYAADMFTTQIGDVTYVAVFNFNNSPAGKSIDFARIGLSSGTYTVKELWENKTYDDLPGGATWNIAPNVPAYDSRIYKIYPKDTEGILPPVIYPGRPDPDPDPPVVIPDPVAPISEAYMNAAPAPDWEVIKDALSGLPATEHGRFIWGDYNNDGNLDAFLFSKDSVGLYRNNGDGSFTDMPVLPPEMFPLDQGSALFIDYNNDGNLDLITIGLGGGKNINYTDGYIFVFKNSGPPDYTFAFDRENTINLLGGRSRSASGQGRMLQAVDIDNDGWIDLIEAANLSYWVNETSRLMTVYKNNQGIFERKTNLVTGRDFRQLSGGSVHVGDVNGDSYADILCVGYGDNSGGFSSGFAAKLYINSGNGTFTESPYSSSLGGRENCETLLADVNGDGYDDMIEISSQYANIHINNGTGTSFTKYSMTGLQVKDCPGISVGDVNNDGKLDILVSGMDHPNTTIYYNNGTGTSFTGVQLPDDLSTRAGSTVLVDMDGDGNLDFSAFGWSDNADDYRNAFVLNKLGNGIDKNEAPSVPANLDIAYILGRYHLKWDKSTDDKTPQNAIRYNVYARNKDTGMTYMYAPAHVPSGKLKIQDGLIPLISTNSFRWNLPAGNYVFGVSAVDQSNRASGFAFQCDPDDPECNPNSVKTTPVDFNHVSVYSIDKGIQIVNEDIVSDLNYSVYGVDGRQISSGCCAAGSHTFISTTHGVYIVKVYQGSFTKVVKLSVF